MEGKMISNKNMEKQWKNRGILIKTWSQIIEKQWKNCDCDVVPK